MRWLSSALRPITAAGTNAALDRRSTGLGLEARGPERDAVSSAAFGHIQGFVRRLEQALPVAPRFRKGRDADGASDFEGPRVTDEPGLCELRADSLRKELSPFLIGLLADQHELFAAETPDCIR